MATIIKGNQIQLFYQGKTFAYATSHTLNITGNTSDSANKDTGVYGSNEVTSITWEVTGEYFYTDYDYDTLFDLMMYRRPILVEVGEVRNFSDDGLISTGGDIAAWIPSTITRRGYAAITALNTTANNSENATYSITLTGSGPLVVVDNTTTNFYIDVTYSAITEDMKLFDDRAMNSVNSGWVYEKTSGAVRPQLTQIDITGGKLNDDLTSYTNPALRFYLASAMIPDYMFRGVSALSTAEVNASITEVGSHAFDSSGITSIDFGAASTGSIKYKDHCFSMCIGLTHVNYDTRDALNRLEAKWIGSNAFNSCVRLVDIDTGDACEYVSAGGFSDCASMNTIYFGDSLVRLNDNAFSLSSHPTVRTYHFYTESAPDLGILPLGNESYASIILHDSTSVNEWLSSNDTWRQYSGADIQLAS